MESHIALDADDAIRSGLSSDEAHRIHVVGPAVADVESNLSSSVTPDRVFGATVTLNALDTLGIHPARGNFFSNEDAVAGQDHDVVISCAYWRHHFGGDASAMGRSIRIVGVLRMIIP